MVSVAAEVLTPPLPHPFQVPEDSGEPLLIAKAPGWIQAAATPPTPHSLPKNTDPRPLRLHIPHQCLSQRRPALNQSPSRSPRCGTEKPTRAHLHLSFPPPIAAGTPRPCCHRLPLLSPPSSGPRGHPLSGGLKIPAPTIPSCPAPRKGPQCLVPLGGREPCKFALTIVPASWTQVYSGRGWVGETPGRAW